jgi:hypothetical protein
MCKVSEFPHRLVLMKGFVLDFSNYVGHSSYGVKARHGDGGAPGRLGAHFARRWGSAWTPRRRHENYDVGLFLYIVISNVFWNEIFQTITQVMWITAPDPY